MKLQERLEDMKAKGLTFIVVLKNRRQYEVKKIISVDKDELVCETSQTINYTSQNNHYTIQTTHTHFTPLKSIEDITSLGGFK